MTLQRRLFMGFGSLWLIFLIATALSIAGLKYYGNSLQSIFHDNYDSVRFCDNMKQSLDDLDLAAQMNVWQHIVPPPETLQKAKDLFNTNAQAEINNANLPGEPELSKSLRDQGQDYQKQLDRFWAAPDPERPGIYRAELLHRYRNARATAQTTSDLNIVAMRSTDLNIRQSLNRVSNALVGFVLLGATLAIASIFFLARAILNPLRQLIASVRQIEAGDLNLTVPVRSSDEIGRLAEAFNSMAATLREYRRIDHLLLLRTQQTTQLAIDSLPDAVVVFSPAGKVEISNRVARTNFGVDEGRCVTDIPLDWLRTLFAGVLETGQPVEPRGYQSAIQLFDAGEERFLLPRAVPMRDAQGEIIGVVVTLVDVTRLHHADELKSDLVSTVSHELKTPLTPTRMAMHMLAQQTVGPLNANQLKLVNAAKENADRLHRIIENLLNISRVEYGRRALQFAALPPGAIIEQAVAALRPEFEKKRVALQVQVPPQLPAVWADANCIGHVVTNLLSNALKFTPSGGHVEVIATPQPDGVSVTVSDSGPGIADEFVPRIFEKFFRVPMPNGPPGAGLGLSIAREIMAAHGGKITVATEVGHGARFTFVLGKPAAAGAGLRE